MPAQPDQNASQKIRRRKNDFLRALFHDIRTPLASVKEAGSLLWEEVLGPLNEAQKKCAGIARTEIRKIQHGLDLILDLSLLEDDSRDFSLEWVPLENLLDSCLSPLEKKCADLGWRFEKKSPPLSGILHVDPEGLRKAFYFLSQGIFEHAGPQGALQASFQTQGDGASLELRRLGGGNPPHPWLSLTGNDASQQKELWKQFPASLFPASLSKGFAGLSLLELLGFGFELEETEHFVSFRIAIPGSSLKRS